MDGDAVGLLEVFFAQASGKGGVDADACASSYGDHQVLCGKARDTAVRAFSLIWATNMLSTML